MEWKEGHSTNSRRRAVGQKVPLLPFWSRENSAMVSKKSAVKTCQGGGLTPKRGPEGLSDGSETSPWNEGENV